MKRFISIILTLVLMSCCCAAAEGGILMCIGCTVNGMSSLSFVVPTTYTAIVKDGVTVSGWKVNGKFVEGQKDSFLVFTADGNTVVEAVAAGENETYDPDEDAASEKSAAPTLPAGPVHVKAIGAHLQYIDKNGNPGGESVTEIDFADAYTNPLTGEMGLPGIGEFRVTADKPHQGDIDYWVLNGVRYDFCNTVRYMNVENLREDLTIEVVYKKAASTTQNSLDSIRKNRTGGKLTVSCEDARMSMVKGSTASGGYFTEFDFTSDYRNPATNANEPGGQISLKVIANKKTVRSWEFGSAILTFSTDSITHFFVRNLDCSMTYKPN